MAERAAVLGATVAITEAAALMEITPKRLHQLMDAAGIEKSGKGDVALATAVRCYLNFLKDDQRRASRSAAGARVQDARAREIDLKIAERDGRLIDAVEHRDLFAECFGALKTGLDGVSARLTNDIAFRRKIETEIDDVLRRAADRFEQAAADAAPAGEVAAADAADDT